MNDKGNVMTTRPGWVKGLPPAGPHAKLWWLAEVVTDDTGPHFGETLGVEVSNHEGRWSLWAFMSENHLLGGLHLLADKEFWHWSESIEPPPLLAEWTTSLGGPTELTRVSPQPNDPVREEMITEAQRQHLADAVGAVGDASTDFFALLAMVRKMRATAHAQSMGPLMTSRHRYNPSQPPVGEESETPNIGIVPDAPIGATAADAFRDAILKKTGLKPAELVCPREKSAMTPCVARDGGAACSDSGHCVGCEQPVTALLAREVAR